MATMFVDRLFSLPAAAVCALIVAAAPRSCSDPVHVQLRADPSQATSLDVKWWVDFKGEARTGMTPGYIDLGMLPFGTLVTVEVTRPEGGYVSANILGDRCFRASTQCSTPGCVARAEWRVASLPCIEDGAGSGF